MSKENYQKCPICSSPSIISSSPDGENVQCLRCGDFIIERTVLSVKTPLNVMQIAIISSWLYEHQVYEIDSKTWKRLLELKGRRSVGEKATRLLKHIANENPIPGKWFKIDFHSIYNLPSLNLNKQYPNKIFDDLKKALPYLAVTSAIDGNELNYIINDYLIKEQEFVIGNHQFKITPKGWAFLESLKYKNTNSQIAFIAMWFDKSVDNLYSSIERTIIKMGYEPKRVDRHEHVNRIDDEIIALIRQSKFIVADYTEQREGVYFESGFAQGLGLPVVWTCRKDDLVNLHFDTSHFNFLTWEEDNLSDFEKRLKNRILAVIGRGTFNPE